MLNKNVLIIDDDINFCNGLAECIRKESKGVFEPIVCQPPSFDSLKKNSPHQGFFEVLLDFNLNLDWLSQLEKDSELVRRLRLWIITGTPDLDVGGLRKQYPGLCTQIKTRWFDKTNPQFVDEIIESLKSPQKNLTQIMQHEERRKIILPEWLYDFPIAIRVIDHKGGVIETNKPWTDNPYVPAIERPDPDRIFDDEAKREWSELHGWGPLPHPTGQSHVKSGYYCLRQKAVRDDRLIQLLTPLEKRLDTLENKIEQLLKMIVERHFKRARFYRIRSLSCEVKTITLEKEFGGLAESFKPPIIRPLVGKIYERLLSYLDQDQRQKQEKQSVKTLLFKIFIETEQLMDEEWFFWNGVVDNENVTNWLEIPIIGQERGKSDVLGFIICDCKDKATEGNLLGGSISHNAKRWLENSLLNMVAELSRLLKEDKLKRCSKARQRVQETQQSLINSYGLEKLNETILNQAVMLTEAEGGALLTRVEGSDDYLEISAKQGNIQNQFAYRIPAKADILPSIKAWKTGKTQVILLFQKSETKNLIINTDQWKYLVKKSEQRTEIEEWLCNKLDCVISAPLKLGERVIGAVTLHHSQGMHFDDERVFMLEELLSLAAPILESETQKEHQMLWMNEIVHRLGSRINALAGSVETAYAFFDQQKELIETARQEGELLRSLLKNIREQEHHWNLQNQFLLCANTRFSSLIDFLCKENSLAIRRRLIMDVPEPNLLLQGDSEALNLVLENLLRNALQHGDENNRINIFTDQQQKNFWTLRISNVGYIPDKDLENLFKFDRRGSRARGEGLGMGLAISRRITRLHNGDLSLEDKGISSNKVTFRLEWPWAKKDA